MLQITARISGEAKAMEKLKKLGTEFLEFDAALHQIGDELKSYYSGQAFKSQGGVYGTPWAQLSPSTQAYKIKHYPEYAAIPLIASDTMRKSFRATVTSRKLVIDNTAPYFDYHQSSAPRHKIPRRQMLGINGDVKHIIKKIIERDINNKLGAL